MLAELGSGNASPNPKKDVEKDLERLVSSCSYLWPQVKFDHERTELIYEEC